MDDEFSEYIRSEVEKHGEYYGPLYTEDEVDAMLDFDEGYNVDLPTKVVEAAFYRQTGVKVDLDVQGAAALNVVKASTNTAEHQQHNTISVEKAVRVQRTFDRRLDDSELVPMLTPEDPNVAVRSMDFAAGKVAASKLDLITLDANESPVEHALIDQLVVCQAMKSMGANVDSLLDHIEETWGINYAHKLVDNVALAPIAEIQNYLAVGGRPSPQLYVSANYASSYRVVDRPTADIQGVGYSSAFFARSAAICKMICIMVEMIHGAPVSSIMSFNTNPSQFNTFQATSLEGITLVTHVDAVYNPICKSLASATNYEEFLRARQAIKHVDAVGRTMALRDLKAIEKAAMIPCATSFSHFAKRMDIFDPRDIQSKKYDIEPEQAAPSRVTTMLFGFMHGDKVAGDFLRSYEAILSVYGICIGSQDAASVARAYATMVSMPGCSHLLRSLNITRAKEAIKELGDLLANTNDARRMSALYLICRQRALNGAVHENAFVAYRDWIMLGVQPNVLKDRGPYVINGYRRSLRYQLDYMRHVIHARPYSYLGKLHKGMNNGIFATSVFDRRASANVEDLIWFEKWYQEHSKKLEAALADGINNTKNVYVPRAKLAAYMSTIKTQSAIDVKVQEFRIVFSNLRSKWSQFYDSYSRVYMSVYRLATSMNPERTYKLNAVKRKPRTEKDIRKLDALVLGCAIESIMCRAKATAYRWCRITLNKTLGGNDPAIDKYAEMLLNVDYDSISKLVEVDPMYSYQNANSKLDEEVDRYVSEIQNYMNKIEMPTKTVKALYYSAYNSSVKSVSRSVVEMIQRDHSMLVEPVEERTITRQERPLDAPVIVSEQEKERIMMNFLQNLPASKVVTGNAPVPDWAKEAYGAVADVSFDVKDSDPDLHAKLLWIEDHIKAGAESIQALQKNVESLTRTCNVASFAGPDAAAECFDDESREDVDTIYRALGGGDSKTELIE